LRAKLHGLFVFAKISGLILGVQIMTGADISEIGTLVPLLKGLSDSFEEIDPLIVPIIAIVIPVTNFFTVIYHVKTAVQHRGRGVAVSCGGFFSVLTLTLGALGGASGLVFLGVIGWFASIITANYKLDG